jgi:hypothetical protein
MTTSCPAGARLLVKRFKESGWTKERTAATPRRHHGATRCHVQATAGSRVHSGLVGELERCQTDRRIEEKVMARKKDKKAQKGKKGKKGKKAKKTQLAQSTPTAAPEAVAPPASPRPKKS